MPVRLKNINELAQSGGKYGLNAKGQIHLRDYEDMVFLTDALIKDVLKLQKRVKKLEKKVSRP